MSPVPDELVDKVLTFWFKTGQEITGKLVLITPYQYKVECEHDAKGEVVTTWAIDRSEIVAIGLTTP
jgi:hypothetical protein